MCDDGTFFPLVLVNLKSAEIVGGHTLTSHTHVLSYTARMYVRVFTHTHTFTQCNYSSEDATSLGCLASGMLIKP